MKPMNFIRVLAFLGIMGLFILQYTWFKNSYSLIEQEIGIKCKISLQKAVEEELFARLNSFKNKVQIQRTKSLTKDDVYDLREVNETSAINFYLQDIAASKGKPINTYIIDSLFSQKLQKQFGFIPNHSIIIVHNLSNEFSSTDKFIYFQKISETQTAKVVLVNPLGSILRQAQMIVIVSIVLVIIIGVVLIYLLKSTVKEAKFVTFIKEYTHALTHELKTPISGIYMASSQLSSGVFEERPDARNRYYGMIRESSSKLLSTVDRILLVAKAEHSKITTNPTPTDVRIFIEKIADAHRSNNFRRKDVTITTSCLPDDLTANFDPFLMENVLNNLIDNAMKYSEQQVSIDIQASLADDKLELRVKDTGFGIAENELKYIFDNFERGNKVQGKGIDGFGIGLNYVNKVVKAHKGTIDVQSQEGKGTEFRILLPQ